MNATNLMRNAGVDLSKNSFDVYDMDIMCRGQSIVPIIGRGRRFYLDPANGSDSNDGKTPTRAFATLAAAYAACTANRNDTVVYLAGSSGLTMSAALTWAKSYTHLVGVCAPTMVGQRARIFQLSTLTGASPLIDVTASGCSFSNFYAFQGVDDATSLINVRVTGSRNHFYNVHFAGGGHATQAINGGASLYISGGSENTFQHCTIGVDTIAAGTGMAGLVFAATGGAARNVFEDCHFTMYAGHAGAIFVEVLGNSGIDRYQIFKRCMFINLSATAMTEAICVAAGFDANNKRLLLEDCSLIGAGEWESNNRGAVYMNRGTITAGGNSGILQATNTT